MAATSKQLTDTKRLKYIRVLERFVRSIMGYLAKEDACSYEGFCTKVATQEGFLHKVEAVPLYKEEFSELFGLVERIRLLAKSPCEDFAALQERLLHDSNRLHKLKNNKKYKKDKHSQKKFSEWD